MPKLLKISKMCKVFSITGKYLKLTCQVNSDVDLCKQDWSKEIISLFNLKINVLGNPTSTGNSFLLVGNHVSYLDIPVLLNSSPDITFVSKKEIKSWPVVGKAAVKAKTIFVERSNRHSRGFVKNQIANYLIENNQKVVIFPSGTTSIRTSSFWRKGAFEIAKNSNVKIQPFRIKYTPLRIAAYVGKDHFLTHMYRLFCFDEINVTLEFHDPVFVTDIVNDCSHWKNWCEQ